MKKRLRKCCQDERERCARIAEAAGEFPRYGKDEYDDSTSARLDGVQETAREIAESIRSSEER